MGFAEARKRAGLTQQEVADNLGVSAAAVSMWETGRMFPRASQLVRIAELYDCSVEDLMKKE